jgi:hypothetical protein
MLEPLASSLNSKLLFGRMRTEAKVTSSLSFIQESSWGKPQMNLWSSQQCTVMVREARDESLVKFDEANKGLHLLFV